MERTDLVCTGSWKDPKNMDPVQNNVAGQGSPKLVKLPGRTEDQVGAVRAYTAVVAGSGWEGTDPVLQARFGVHQ